MLRRSLLLSVALGPLTTWAAAHRRYVATVSHVTDGDTVWVRPTWGADGIAVRLQGIDAPEICQPWGLQARDALAVRLLHQPVTVIERARDDYGRTVARLDWNGTDVGAWLVATGLAWSARYGHRPGPYDAQQAQASQARLGLWSDPRPQLPRTFRKQHGRCAHPGPGGS